MGKIELVINCILKRVISSIQIYIFSDFLTKNVVLKLNLVREIYFSLLRILHSTHCEIWEIQFNT